jgi:hypothetical protein
MTFAAHKCLVVAKNPTHLTLGPTLLPQVKTCKYLGIPFNHKGPDWNLAAETFNRKATNAIMLLAKKGFNKFTWCPSVKIGVYKIFVRSIMEYGMQCHIYSSKDIKLFEKTQQLALRIAYGVPWNTSKTALKRLSCLESIKFRNQLLNSRFILKSLLRGDKSIPAVAYMMEKLDNRKTIIYQWKHFNPTYSEVHGLDEKKARKELSILRYNNIQNEELGLTGISNSIQVDPSMKLPSILSWDGEEDSKIKLEIIQWRLGRVAYHQHCLNCHRAQLSRRHALECSGVDENLFNEFQNINLTQSSNILDSILNHFKFERDTKILEKISVAIQTIKRVCLHTL